MAFIALKPCRFAGQDYKVGECVPDEMVHPGAAKNLKKMGVISECEDNALSVPSNDIPQQTGIPVMIHEQGGCLPLNVMPGSIQDIFDVLISKVGAAETIIQGMEDRDALILLNIVDSRKLIKEAAEARAQELNKEQTDNENDEFANENGEPDNKQEDTESAGEE